MSEPYSVILKTHIDRPALVKWLDAPMEPVAQWNDWSALGNVWFNIDWTSAPQEHGAYVDRISGHDIANTHRQSAQRMFIYGAGPAPLELCAYDESQSLFTYAIGMYDTGPFGLLCFLSWARSIAPYLGDMQSGYAVAHNYLWGRSWEGALGVLGLGPNQSMLLEPLEAHVKAYRKHAEDAIRSFDAAGFDEADIDDYVTLGKKSPAYQMLGALR